MFARVVQVFVKDRYSVKQASLWRRSLTAVHSRFAYWAHQKIYNLSSLEVSPLRLFITSQLTIIYKDPMKIE